MRIYVSNSNNYNYKCSFQKTTLNRAKAETILRRAVELAIYHDCLADNEFEIGVVGKTEKASVKQQKPIIGDWSIAETNCQYE